MSKTNWEKMVNEKTINSAKSARRKQFDTLKIKADDLLQYVDEGWEKSKEYKNPKFVGITKEKEYKSSLRIGYGCCLRAWAFQQ